MRRETRKDLKHDEFVDSTVRAIQHVQEDPKPYLIGVVAVVAVALGAWGTWAFMSSRADSAAEKLARAISAVDAPIDVAGTADPDSAFAPTFPSREARRSETEERLADAEGMGGTTASLATLLSGVLSLEEQDYDAAIESLERAEKRLGSDPTLGGVITAALARACEGGGKLERAESLWRGLSEDEAAMYPKPASLEGLARTLAAQGRAEEADQTYRTIIREFPSSPSARTAEAARAEG